MRRRTLGVAGLLWVSLFSAAAAEEQAVQLRYRFQPGQEFRYRMTVTGDLGMSMGGMLPAGANRPPRMPITTTATYELVQKVKSVSAEGVATVAVGFDRLDTAMSIMGMNMTSRLGPGGKVEMLMNGQPMPIAGAGDFVLPNPLAEVTIAPTGKVTGANPESLNSLNQLAGGQNLSGMFGGNLPGLGGLILPPRPVKPGDTWEHKSTMRMPVSMPGAPAGLGGAAPALTVDYTFQNKLLRVEEGRAVIETKMTARMPRSAAVAASGAPGLPPGMGMKVDHLDLTMTGTQRFQIEEGTVEGSDFDTTTATRMSLGAPAGAPPAALPEKPAAKPSTTPTRPQDSRPAAPSKRASGPSSPAPEAAAPPGLQISVDGTMKLKLERLTAPVAAETR